MILMIFFYYLFFIKPVLWGRQDFNRLGQKKGVGSIIHIKKNFKKYTFLKFCFIFRSLQVWSEEQHGVKQLLSKLALMVCENTLT